MLDARNHQGKFAEDYVRALASAAGLLIYKYDLDRDGIDLGFRHPGRAGHVSSPTVEAQIKSWSRPRSLGGELIFDGLNEAQFNKLTGTDSAIPRYLFVVTVPSDSGQYAQVETAGMLLRQLGYFQSLEHMEPVAQPSRSRRRIVKIPTGNVLTVRTLQRLVHPLLELPSYSP